MEQATETTKQEKGTTAKNDNKSSTTKPAKSSAKTKKQAKNPNASNVPWSIRGVERETRTAFEMACERSNKTAGEFFNTDIRDYLNGYLKKASTPPASPDDIKKMVEADLNQFKSIIEKKLDDRTGEILKAIQQSQNVGLVQRIRKAILGK